MRKVVLHDKSDFESMRKAGNLAKRTLCHAINSVKCGITTNEINRIVHDFILSHGGIPAPLNYRGFPKSVCTSINHVVCHGIPDETILKDGDIINVDVTVILDGWHGDTSITVLVKDELSDENAQKYEKQNRIMDITKRALEIGIDAVKPGCTTGDLGYAIQSFVESNGYSVVRDFCGHGIGRKFHDFPEIRHFGTPKTGVQILPGMFFTIEPMVNESSCEVKILQDGWTVVTRDGMLSAQYEHTIGVNFDGSVVIFTE
ncbi:type I methionyl aminopeptidase [Candidatus Gromoviella agglomerans]|uniref:type I methionyl aminopeptidase n=1 Tax=Candidatus Gromoviella agglomerans TaxID=2806609 RepID=UPI001E5BE2D1|nr:type I methionyl aminopeptidase [Candidatus Gromoviella agglomerans]UFX98177.1 Methionine aminopeptidase [Candidatus Gromoviella agglomerans]